MYTATLQPGSAAKIVRLVILSFMVFPFHALVVHTGLYMISATCGLVDAVCFLALGAVFAERMTGNLLLMALSIGTGSALGQSARYIPAIVVFSLGAQIGGRLLRGPANLM
jgi:uncharacterized membrane protein YoaK (UPF0700 family)